MMRRLPLTIAGAPLVTVVGARTFSSEYSNSVGKMKPSHKFDSRSAAHRRPPRQTTWKSKDTPVTTPASHDAAEDAHETTHEEPTATEPTNIPRRVKNRYQSFHESRREPITFTSTFASGAADAGADRLEDAVTKIYSSDEVSQMTQNDPTATAPSRNTDDLSALSGDANADLHQAEAAEVDESLTADGDGDEGHTDRGSFAAVRDHPYFNDLVRRADNNMVRYRKAVRSTGRYNPAVVDDCIRPLLQLVDYPFTPTKLSELVHSISPVVLRNSLKELQSCLKLHIYHSKETDVVLDWTVEDFLRRRYESIHISWEPLEVVRKRYGWTQEVLTDRDCLLYFSQFTDLVELGELRVNAKGSLKAVRIDDPVALAQGEAPVPPSSRLLVRRVAHAETEPSITETIRLMGTPALERASAGSRATRTRRQSQPHSNPATVADVFEAAEDAADEVEGDEEAKLQHAAAVVKPLRQASHPSGRVIKDISLGRRLTPEESAEAMETPNATAATKKTESVAPSVFDTASYESLTAAYHKAKVESSVLRRQLLSTDNMEMVARLEAKLAGCRKEMRRLEGLLTNALHEGHASDDLSPEGAEDAASTVNADTTDHTGGGFRLPQSLPKYAEAPEFDEEAPKNHHAAAEADLDEDEIERAIQDFDAEVEGIRAGAAATSSSSRASAQDGRQSWLHRLRTPKATPSAAACGAAVRGKAAARAHHTAAEETMTEEIIAEEISARGAAAPAEDSPADQLEETPEYKAMLRDKAAHEARMAKMAAQLAEMEKRLAEAAAAEKRAAAEKQAAQEKARREAEARARAEEARAALEARQKAEAAAEAARREKARLREVAARKAEAQRRQAEVEALALEAELEKKLAAVRAKLQHVSSAAEDVEDVKPNEEEEVAGDAYHGATLTDATPSAVNEAATAAAEMNLEEGDTQMHGDDHREQPTAAQHPASTTTTTTTNSFTCTPEQYDGLQLAATRLRREIAMLEHQMEEEGDEDDETLMTVLAASRADLEELDECIHSVQANEAWAAERDAKRQEEERRASEEEDTEFRRVQRAIDDHRFSIELLNRRIQHATSRPVISALEQRVVQARREVARLRVTQDRLLREGRGTFGLPHGVSMAKSLAGELKDSEAKTLAEEVKRAAAGLPPANTTSDDTADSDQPHPPASTSQHRSHADAADETAVAVPKIVQEDPAMRQLRQRLDSILRSIQNVQESLLRMRDAPAAYDEEEEEAALADMKDKLGQLLALRDDILSRLKETAVVGNGGADGASSGPDREEDMRGHPLPLLRTPTSVADTSASQLATPKPHTLVGGVAQHRPSAHRKINAAARARKGRN